MNVKNSDIYRIGSYDIFLNNRIGIGSYSIVYQGRCHDTETINLYNINKSEMINGKNVSNIIAIKKILIRDVSGKVRKAINDEINIMKHIKNDPHPNIVKCYDVIDDIDTIYIIMEYCDSGDLSKIIGRPMKEENVKYYFKQLICGIKYLNKNKIMHRDIKPKNILLNENKKFLKICDFGLAKTISSNSMTRSYTICGSPLYMAPEMFGEKSYNDTVDIWSIGILLYEMIYGINPFYKVKDRIELERFMISENDDIIIPPKYSRNDDVSDECINLMKLLLQKDAGERITFEDLYVHEWVNKNNKNNEINLNNDSNNETKSDSDSDYGSLNDNKDEYIFDNEDDRMLFLLDTKK